jgi:hypothetical protein
MSKKQEALIRAIKAAQEAGGFLQKQLAAMACTSPGNICIALSGAGNMSEEKWRLLCEGLALDYDAIVAEVENAPRVVEESAPAENPAPAAEVQQEEPVRCESAAPECEEIAPECEIPAKNSGGGGIVADYLERKLAEDLRNGTSMPISDLCVLLDYLRVLRRA